MKLALVTLVIAVAVASAVEDPSDQLVKICGGDMLKALHQACEHKNVQYLLKHAGPYDHNRNHAHDHKHQHHDSTSSVHNHGHDHAHHQHDNHSHGEKNEKERSIAEECCYKPCHVKDFMKFCG